MSRVRGVRALAFVSLATTAPLLVIASCNAILGNEERQIDQRNDRDQVEGAQFSGKMSEVGQPEPPGYQVVGTAATTTTRGVGYYVYNTFDAILESMVVTVP